MAGYASPDVAEPEAFGERIGRVKSILRASGYPALTADFGNDRLVPTNGRGFDQPALESRTERPFVDEGLADIEPASSVHGCGGRRCASAARAAIEHTSPGLGAIPVELAGRERDDVAPVSIWTVRRTVEQRDRRPRERSVDRMHNGELVDGCGSDHLADSRNLCAVGGREVDAEHISIGHRKEHSAPDDIDRDRADRRHLDRLNAWSVVAT